MENTTRSMHGMDWSRLRMQLLWAYHDRPNMPYYREPKPEPLMWVMDAGWMYAYSSAWLLIRGRVSVTSRNGRVVKAAAGQWMFPMGRLTHEFSGDAEIVSITFVAHWPDDVPLYRHEEPVVCDASQFTELTKAAWRLVGVSKVKMKQGDNPPDQMRTAMLLGRYLDITRSLLRWLKAYDAALSELGLERTAIGEGDERVMLLQRRIDMMPLGEAFDERAAAKSVGLSVSQLNRVFVGKTGMTPRTYHQRRRLRFAEDSLLQTSMPVKQLAFLLNFRQATSFSRWFRKYAGRYPREFRENGAKP